MQFQTKEILSEKNVFFGFLPQTSKNKIKTLKSHILCRNFVLILIAYVILVIGFFCKLPLILLKTLKNMSFKKFLRKNYVVVIFIIFYLFFYETIK